MANKNKEQDYKALSAEALLDRIADEELRLKKLKFSHAVNPIENPMQIRSLRREIARLNTEVTKKDLGL